MRDTWQHAILSNEKHFTQKDLVEIKKTTKPDDLLGFIKTLEVKDDKSNISKIARRIGMLGVYFNTYERSLDLIAQGLPSPGCLVWGSIKFALSVSASENPSGMFFEPCLVWGRCDSSRSYSTCPYADLSLAT